METHLSEDEDGDNSNEEFLFLAIKEKDKGRYGRPKNTKNSGNLVKGKDALLAKVEPKAWIVDSGCSNNIKGDKGKFLNLKKYNSGFVKFIGEEDTPI